MNPFQAKQQINTGIEQYEAGRITLGALHTLVDETVNALESEAFNAGLGQQWRQRRALYDVEVLEDEDGEVLEDEDGEVLEDEDGEVLEDEDGEVLEDEDGEVGR